MTIIIFFYCFYLLIWDKRKRSHRISHSKLSFYAPNQFYCNSYNFFFSLNILGIYRNSTKINYKPRPVLFFFPLLLYLYYVFLARMLNAKTYAVFYLNVYEWTIHIKYTYYVCGMSEQRMCVCVCAFSQYTHTLCVVGTSAVKQKTYIWLSWIVYVAGSIEETYTQNLYLYNVYTRV